MTDIYPIKPLITEDYRLKRDIIIIIILLILLIVIFIINKFYPNQKNEKTKIKTFNLKNFKARLNNIKLEDKDFYNKVYYLLLDFLGEEDFKGYTLEEIKSYIKDLFSSAPGLTQEDIDLPELNLLKKVYFQLYQNQPDSLEKRKEILQELEKLLD